MQLCHEPGTHRVTTTAVPDPEPPGPETPDGPGPAPAARPPAARPPAARPPDGGPPDGGGARLGRPTTRLGTALRWSYVMSTGGNAIQVLLTLVVAALLGPREFGLMALAMVWVALVLVLLQFGPTFAVIQQHDITDEHVNASFWATLWGSAGCAVLLAATAPLWAAYSGLPELVPLCLALTPVVVLQACNVIQDAILRRRMQMRGIAIRVMLANLGGGVTAVAGAAAGLGVWALVAQQLVWPTLYAVMLWPIAGWRPRRGPILGPLRDLRKTSLQTYGGSIGGYLSTRVDVLLLGAFFGPEIIGLWRFAHRLSEMANELTAGGLNVVSLPHLARHGEDSPALERELGRLMYGASLLTFPALGILAGTSEAVVRFIGDQWVLAAGPLRVLCAAAAAATVATILGVSLAARQRPGIPALFNWVTIPCLAAGLLVAARLSTGQDPAGKLLAISVAALAVQLLITGALGYVTFRWILRVPAWPTVVLGLPGLAAAGAGALAGSQAYRLVDESLNRFFDLAASGTVAVVAAAAALLALDRGARVVAGRLLSRLRGRLGGRPPSRPRSR
jgi:O-antigen/teichoic acid export membrane protein